MSDTVSGPKKPYMTSTEDNAVRILRNRAMKDPEFADWLAGKGISKEFMLSQFLSVLLEQKRGDVALMTAMKDFTGTFLEQIKAERTARKEEK